MSASPHSPTTAARPRIIYPQVKGEYSYDVTITKDVTAGPSRQYHARLSNAARMMGRRLVQVQVEVPDAYGPTVTEATRALEASFNAWHREHLP